MKKFRFLVLAVAFLAMGLPQVKAQQEETQGKPVVYMDYFYRPTNVDANYAQVLRNFILQAITETQRVRLIDVDTNATLAAEKSRRESGELSAGDDANRLKVMTQEGANYLIQGSIDNLAITEVTPEKGSKYYRAILTLTLKVVDPNNGNTIGSESFNVGQGITEDNTGSTAQEAIITVCKTAKKKIDRFVDTYFAVVGKILEVGEIKKDEVKTLYISLGSSVGVVKGDEFEVKKNRQIAGKPSATVIGKIKVEAVEGDEISLAKVTKGGKEIKAAIDADDNLTIVSVPKGLKPWEKVGL